jgi:hypothetical protein
VQHANWSARSLVVLGTEPGEGINADACQLPRQRQQALYLVAALLISEAPLAKVLAVIAEQSIGIFTKARTRPAYHLGTIETSGGVTSDPDGALLRETFKRNFFHRAPAEIADQ